MTMPARSPRKQGPSLDTELKCARSARRGRRLRTTRRTDRRGHDANRVDEVVDAMSRLFRPDSRCRNTSEISAVAGTPEG